ncbi:MAG: hypothetical protein QOE11_152 [Solirubrobacteraceae bacterium]|jgi:hypothetical protein|nr:hypothetical protein [Solirubrobacteraceae bacterium]
MRTSSKCIIALVATAALAMAATAVAAVDGPTQVTVEPAAALTAGDRSPFDVPGVKAIRRGKVIPSGYVLPGQKVTIKRGKLAAGASLFFKCPGGKRLKSFATTGAAGFGARQPYVNHRQAFIESFRNIDAIGVVYAVCR